MLASEIKTSIINNLIIGTPTNYTFEKGKSVGFVLFADGWKDNFVNVNVPRYFTNSMLNPENVDWLKNHTASVKTSNGKLVMGIEDLRRDQSSCDHDFNDLIIIISTNLSKISRQNFSDPTEKLLNDAPLDYELGYKKLLVNVLENNKTRIVEVFCVLRIPLTSGVVKHISSNKFRTDRAYIYSITGIPKTIFKDKMADGKYTGTEFESAYSAYRNNFIYTKNLWISNNLNKNQNINSEGIHYFKTREQAMRYIFKYLKI